HESFGAIAFVLIHRPLDTMQSLGQHASQYWYSAPPPPACCQFCFCPSCHCSLFCAGYIRFRNSFIILFSLCLCHFSSLFSPQHYYQAGSSHIVFDFSTLFADTFTLASFLWVCRNWSNMPLHPNSRCPIKNLLFLLFQAQFLSFSLIVIFRK